MNKKLSPFQRKVLRLMLNGYYIIYKEYGNKKFEILDGEELLTIGKPTVNILLKSDWICSIISSGVYSITLKGKLAIQTMRGKKE